MAASTFDVVIGGEAKSFYPTERDSVNDLLTKNARAAIDAAEEAAAARRREIEAAVPTVEELAPSLRALVELSEGYAESHITITPEALVADQQLALPASELARRGEDPKAHELVGHTARGALRDLAKPISLKREVAERGEAVHAAEALFFCDEAVASATHVPLHDSAFANEFAYARSELAALAKSAEPVLAEMKKAAGMREEAQVIGDAPMAEKMHRYEIELREKLLKIARDRVDAANATASDANDFLTTTGQLRDAAKAAIEEHEDTINALSGQVAGDMEKIAGLINAERDKHTQLAQAEDARTAELEKTVRGASEERIALWQQVRELLAKDAQLTEKIAVTRREHVEHVHRVSSRREQFKGFTTALLQHSEGLDRVREHLDAARRFLADEQEFATNIGGVIDAKPLVEDSRNMRHEEMLAYLAQFGDYNTVANDLVHRKETRILAVRRNARNLELQIKEAQHLLDPNKSRYEADLEECTKLIAVLQDDVAALKQRATQEHELWVPVEEMLEDDDVDFEPPDIRAEREHCERKAQALSVARDYVVTEQEHVDRDALALRKAKMAAKVANEDLEARRTAKIQDAQAA